MISPATTALLPKSITAKHISVIDLRNPTRSDGNNLLTLINRYMDIARKQPDNLAARAKAEKYAKILAKSIVSPEGNSDHGQNAFFYDAAEGLLSSTIAVRRFIAAPPCSFCFPVFYIIAQVPPSVVCHSRTKQPVSRRLRQWAEIFVCFPAAMQNKKGTTQCVMPF